MGIPSTDSLASPQLGINCMVILDGSGYMIEPDAYTMIRPRVRRADFNRVAASGGLGVGERYVDMGPGKREWRFIVLAFQAMRTYAGQMVANTGQQIRDSLHTSYNKVNTVLSFTDPLGGVWNVHFDDLVEDLADVRAQVDAPAELQYYCHVTLTEA